MKLVTFKMPEAERLNLRTEAQMRGMTITGLIKVALREYLTKK